MGTGLRAFHTAINILGIRLQARANFVLLAIELVALAVFIVLAIDFVFIQNHAAGGRFIAPFYQPRHLNWDFIATATAIAALGFPGFDAISTLAGEALLRLVNPGAPRRKTLISFEVP